MKKNLLAGLAIGAMVFGIVDIANADSTAIIGQSTVFTAFDYFVTEATDDPGNQGLPDASVTMSSAGNTAMVSVEATPGQASQAYSWIGTTLIFDVLGYSIPDIINLPVTVTFDFNYELSATWEYSTGSANAGIAIPGFTDPWYDFYGHVKNETGATVSNHANVSFTTKVGGQALTIGNLYGTDLTLQLLGQAHSVGDEWNEATNFSHANVTLNSITVTTDLPSPSAVPEPATMILFGPGLAGLVGAVRRKKA